MNHDFRATTVADCTQNSDDFAVRGGESPRGHAGSPVRVVVVDDSDDLRALVRLALAADDRFAIVGQGADGAEAVELAVRLLPDVVLLDLAMPGVDGLTAIPQLRRNAPEASIVVLSGFESPAIARQALECGAHAYVEKGTPLTRLLDVVWNVALRTAPGPTGRGVAPSRTSSSDDPGEGVPVAEELLYRRRVESAMRLARWFAVPFVLAQFILYEEPQGAELTFARAPTAASAALGILALNILSFLASRARTLERLHQAGLAVLVGDTALVMTLVWLFSFDYSSALWALLVIPVLEGAMRAQLRGAVATWALTSVAYVAREAWASDRFAREFEVASVHYRLGVVLLVALASGHLARNLREQSAARDRAAAESRRRAQLLRVVADASRAMASVDVDKVQLAMLEGTTGLGFQTAALFGYDAFAGTWQLTQALGPAAIDPAPHPIGLGVIGTVHESHTPVAVPWGTPLSEFGDAFDPQAVAVLPVEAGTVTVAALLAGTADRETVEDVQLECLSLLTAQAGLAIRNAQCLEEVRERASHDALTGLPNQVLFEDRCTLAMAQADRARRSVALLFIDVDRFKQVNDDYGHDLGNTLLRAVAARLQAALRTGDTVARLGGDEFAVVLAGIDREDDVTTVAEKLVSSFDAPFPLGGHDLRISASIGIACYPEDGDDYGALLRAADLTMYEVKTRGRNGYLRARTRRTDKTLGEARVEADLRRAVREGALGVAYQPLHSLRSGHVVGVEALARWKHPTLGDVPPARFIPVAEELGIVDAIDAHVITTACRQVALWNSRRQRPLRLCVNVSGRHLQEGDVAGVVMRALASSGLEPALVTLELTETSATEHVETIRRALAALKDLSIRIAIDDFGTGYSMLSRVQQYPVDTLKIDRSFVAAVLDGEGGRLLDATITLGRRLDLDVVVEGVETAEQAHFLRVHGCDLVQGFHYGRPLPAEELTELLA